MDKSNLTSEKLSYVGLLNKYRKEIMGFAAIWIILFHEWQYVLPSCRAAVLVQKAICAFGFNGVDIFLLISGIGLTYSIKKSSLGKFYINRLKRVFIPALVMYSIIAIVDKQPILEYLKIASGYSFLFENVYKCLWFIPTILILYLFFPLYDWVLKKSKLPVLITVIALIIWYLVSVMVNYRYDLRAFTNRIPVFLIGVLLGELEQSKKMPKSKVLLWLTIPIFAVGAYTTYYTYVLGNDLLVPAPNCFLPTLLIALSVPIFIALVLKWLSQLFKKDNLVINKVLCFYGAISLELYIVQEWLGGKMVQISWSSTMICNIVLLFTATMCALGLSKLTKGIINIPNLFKKKNKEGKDS